MANFTEFFSFQYSTHTFNFVLLPSDRKTKLQYSVNITEIDSEMLKKIRICPSMYVYKSCHILGKPVA